MLSTKIDADLKKWARQEAFDREGDIADLIEEGLKILRDGVKAKPAPAPSKPMALTADEESAIAALLDAMRDEDASREALKSATLSGLNVWRDHVYQKKKATRSGDQRKRA